MGTEQTIDARTFMEDYRKANQKNMQQTGSLKSLPIDDFAKKYGVDGNIPKDLKTSGLTTLCSVCKYQFVTTPLPNGARHEIYTEQNGEIITAYEYVDNNSSEEPYRLRVRYEIRPDSTREPTKIEKVIKPGESGYTTDENVTSGIQSTTCMCEQYPTLTLSWSAQSESSSLCWPKNNL